FWTTVRDRAAGEHRRQYTVGKQDPRVRAGQALADTLLHDTPYGGRLTPEAAQRIGAADLARWYDRSRVPENAFLVVAGSFEPARSEEHTSELQSLAYLVCRLLLEKKKTT